MNENEAYINTYALHNPITSEITERERERESVHMKLL